jgi:cyclopropane fatty-acyl-phospholipid synthase-like methyltransferase
LRQIQDWKDRETGRAFRGKGAADPYGETFRRMWRDYLLFCAGTFRSRYNQLSQVVPSKKGIREGWRTVR